jgi:hypothetical protein
MANEDEVVIDGEGEDVLGEDPNDDDNTDWKAEAKKARVVGVLPYVDENTVWKAEAKKARGIATRYRTKLVKATEKKKEAAAAAPAPADNKPKDFDYGEKAFMTANGIKRDEYPLVREIMTDTGKSLEDVLSSKHFQAELKDRRDAAATAEATPANSKRSASPTRDTVDYWINKGELPPADQIELRRKVVNEKYRLKKSASQFSKNPIA